MTNSRKVFFDSAAISCKPNAIFSSRIYRLAVANGYEVVEDFARADFIILNTCGFDAHHQGITDGLYRRYSEVKNAETKLISVGCLNKIDPEVAARYPAILFPADDAELESLLPGPVRFADLKSAVVDDEWFTRLARTHTRARNPVTTLSLFLGKSLHRLLKRRMGDRWLLTRIIDELEHHNKIYVEIGKGCVSRCSYCAIKWAKGGALSRPIHDIVEDIRANLMPGKIVVLVADDCGSWGADIQSSLPQLIREIHRNFPEIVLDIPYLHPRWILADRGEYLDLFAKIRFEAVNIPIQSGSNRILSLMNRPYTIEEVIDTIRELRTVSPKTLFWTHIIIGFPSESEEDFKGTLRAAKAFDLVQTFLFSAVEGTQAVSIGDGVSGPALRMRWLRLSLAHQFNLMKRLLRGISASGSTASLSAQDPF